MLFFVEVGANDFRLFKEPDSRQWSYSHAFTFFAGFLLFPCQV